MADKTCVMITRQTFGREYFKCSECGRGDALRDWKFCAGCGAAIERFEIDNSPLVVAPEVQKEIRPKVVLGDLRIEVQKETSRKGKKSRTG